MKWLSVALMVALWWVSSEVAVAESPAPFDALLNKMQALSEQDGAARQAREARFLADHKQQRQLLERLKGQLAAERARSQALQVKFGANEQALDELTAALKQRTGDLGELFGAVRQTVNALSPLLANSPVTAQYPQRVAGLTALGERKRLPEIAELEQIVALMTQEVIESGRVVAFPATVIGSDGVPSQRDVVRIGVFTSIAGGRYLNYLPETTEFAELARQPSAADRRLAADFQATSEGYTSVTLDPSRGVLLNLLVETPGWSERLQQGGGVGYAIIGLGVVGLIVVVVRLSYLALVGRRIRRQLGSIADPSNDNPLGRVMVAVDDDGQRESTHFELQLDEAIMREAPRLTRGESLVKLLAGVAPLLGLLGTVVGMIVTFQSISVFGTGDPKLMAGGISQALVTTALGLIVAVPLLFLHALLSARSRTLIRWLAAESTALIVARREHG